MRIILKDDISSLGKYGDVIQVASGYARNYLVPRGLAIEITDGNLRAVEHQKDAWMRKAQKIKEASSNLKNELEALLLSFARKAGEDEKLFGSVTSMDITAALKDKGFNIDRKKIYLEEPIKSIGVYTVPVKLYQQEVVANLRISVVKE
ncbi:MAG: 50S ribosomal protein L9 [Thermodesulfobacteriota bacterium]